MTSFRRMRAGVQKKTPPHHNEMFLFRLPCGDILNDYPKKYIGIDKQFMENISRRVRQHILCHIVIFHENDTVSAFYRQYRKQDSH